MAEALPRKVTMTKCWLKRFLVACTALSLTACSLDFLSGVRPQPAPVPAKATVDPANDRAVAPAAQAVPSAVSLPAAPVPPPPAPATDAAPVAPPVQLAPLPAREQSGIAPAGDRTSALVEKPDFSYHNATLAEDTVWRGLVQVEGWVTVPPQVTLRVEAGTTVRFVSAEGGKGGLLVQGRLVAAGNSDQPILFASAFRNSAAGDWQGIVLLASDKKNVMEECRIEGAVNGLQALFAQVTLHSLTLASCETGLSFRDAFAGIAGSGVSGCSVGVRAVESELELRDTSISSNRQGMVVSGGSLYLASATLYGNDKTALTADNTRLQASGSSFTVNGTGMRLNGCDGAISYCRFLNNREAGLHLVGSRLRVNGNDISQNSGVGLRIVEGGNVLWGNVLAANNSHDLEYEGAADLFAMGNWWGETEPSRIPERIRILGGAGGGVLYQPPLTLRPQFGF